MDEPIFGIDLGTTNSCLALIEAGSPRAIEIEGEAIVPSVVSLDRATGEVIVGRRARNRMLLEPEATVRSIKRRMGDREPLRLGDRSFLPEEIAAEILRFLKEQGGQARGREVRRAVITVPAYFGDAQRRATVRAGELAGLDVVRLLNEPTAAALVYDRAEMRGVGGTAAAHRGSPGVQRILVYDLGGGTFDVSVVEIGGEVNEVLASCGDNRLGGDDFDLLLAEHLLSEVRERHGADLSGNPRALARLHRAAEQAKIDLSSQPYARVMEEALAPGVHLDLEIERDLFERMIQPFLDRTVAEVERALEEARIDPGQLDRVVLVGGSTHIPCIVDRLECLFACPVEHAVDPTLGVALGAALQGAILGGQVFDQILVDVAAHSLGIKTMGNPFASPLGLAGADHFSTVIRRSSRIPTTRSEVYFTMCDNQERVAVEVYQGESERCSQNVLIGEFPFELAPAPAGSPVVVELSYDLDGIIRVVVSQKGTERRKEVTLSTRLREESSAAAGRRPVDNYILRKARALAATLSDGPLAERLRSAAAAYESALARETEDPRELDQLENDLLDRLDEAEKTDLDGEP